MDRGKGGWGFRCPWLMAARGARGHRANLPSTPTRGSEESPVHRSTDPPSPAQRRPVINQTSISSHPIAIITFCYDRRLEVCHGNSAGGTNVCVYLARWARKGRGRGRGPREAWQDRQQALNVNALHATLDWPNGQRVPQRHSPTSSSGPRVWANGSSNR